MASPVFKFENIKAPKFKNRGKFAPHECVGAEEAGNKTFGKHSFKIAWDCVDGWHILDNKVKIAGNYKGAPTTGLKKCPFCDCQLTIANKVEIV